MKQFAMMMFGVLLFACANQKENSASEPEKSLEIPSWITEKYNMYGDSTLTFDQNKMTTEELLTKYNEMLVGDSVQAMFTSSIEEVCQKKGCWMKLTLPEESNVRVTFKDYGFFMPKDVAGQEAMVSGWAHKEETSIDDLKHYAEDAGKTEEEIAAITEPEVKFTFVADGVLLAKKD